MFLLSVQEFGDYFQGLGLGFVKVIVDDDDIEPRGVAQFEFGLCDAAFNDFGRVCTTAVQAFAQFFYRRRLDEYRQGTFTVILLASCFSTCDFRVP